MKAIFFIFYLIIYCHSEMAIYDKPGVYQLTPEEYEYSDSFLIEMWSSRTLQDEVYPRGSYLKVSIKTNHLTFNVTVGKLGNPYNRGTTTSLINKNINITVEDKYFYLSHNFGAIHITPNRNDGLKYYGEFNPLFPLYSLNGMVVIIYYPNPLSMFYKLQNLIMP
jgi:hypothetical protein